MSSDVFIYSYKKNLPGEGASCSEDLHLNDIKLGRVGVGNVKVTTAHFLVIISSPFILLSNSDMSA